MSLCVRTVIVGPTNANPYASAQLEMYDYANVRLRTRAQNQNLLANCVCNHSCIGIVTTNADLLKDTCLSIFNFSPVGYESRVWGEGAAWIFFGGCLCAVWGRVMFEAFWFLQTNQTNDVCERGNFESACGVTLGTKLQMRWR